MIFILSKILLFLIKPFFWFCILLLASVFIKNKKLRRRFFLTAVFILLLFSNGYLVGKIYNIYEPEYPIGQKKYDIAIVLGGFSGLNKRNNEIQFNWASDRLFQTFTLYKKGRIKKIMVTGGNADLADNKIKEADLVYKFLQNTCIPDTDIFIENQSRNTIENAKFSARLINKKYPHAKILVVTSAMHVQRARLIFSRFFKTKPDYLPTNYIGKNDYSFSDFIPDPGALSAWEFLFKEWIGLVVDKYRN